MFKFLVIFAILSAIVHTVLSDVSELQVHQNRSQLDPINDEEASQGTRNIHDKRTIFKPNLHNVAWAKHVGINPAGKKVVLGFSPVDLKLSPVIRPMSIQPVGYSYPKPSIHFRLRKPVVPARPTVVKPVLKPKPVYGPPLKPAGSVPVAPVAPAPVRPVIGLRPPHVDVIHNEPVPHVDHVHQGDHHVHDHHLHHHGNHLHFGVQQIPHLHLLGHGHVDQVHQIQVAHGGHVDSVAHIDHLHPVPVNPVIQAAPPLRPFVPSPSIFEVTKPNLGVLPFGAVFQTPVLRGLPAPHLHLRGLPAPHLHLRGPFPVLPAAPAVPATPIVPAAPAIPLTPPAFSPVALASHPHFHPVVPEAHPVLPAHHLDVTQGHHVDVIPGHPVGVPHPTHINPPGTVVEYHGSGSIFPVNGHWPILPQTPVNAVQPVLPEQQPVLPHEQHDVQTHFLPVNHPNYQQQFVGNQVADQGYLQHQDINLNEYHTIQQDIPNIQQFQPHEAVQLQENFGGDYDYDQNNVIQPGQSDLQFPLALPQHPFFQDGRAYQENSFQDSQHQSDQIFKPSLTLEPPYKK